MVSVILSNYIFFKFNNNPPHKRVVTYPDILGWGEWDDNQQNKIMANKTMATYIETN